MSRRPVATDLAGSAPRSKSLTSTVRSGAATGTFCASRNENISRFGPHATVPAGLMTDGKIDGLLRADIPPAGVPSGGVSSGTRRPLDRDDGAARKTDAANDQRRSGQDRHEGRWVMPEA